MEDFEFKVGTTYELIASLEYDLEEEDLDELESQDEDSGMVTTEFYEYAKQNNLINEENVIVVPIRTEIIKIENTGYDVIDSYERFVIKGTNVQILLSFDWFTYDELLKEVI